MTEPDPIRRDVARELAKGAVMIAVIVVASYVQRAGSSVDFTPSALRRRVWHTVGTWADRTSRAAWSRYRAEC